MSNAFRLPNVTATTDAGKLKQLQSYMYQLVEQLNIALASVDGSSNGVQFITANRNGKPSAGETDEEAQATFNSVKSLIIKSADIVNAHYEVIKKRLEGLYVAESEFGTYTEETAAEIEANSTAIEQVYTNLQTISTDIDNLEHAMIEVNACIKSGLLYYDDDGAPVYGLEIGQRTEIDGQEVFNKYAQFTAGKLAFFDSNGIEVAYVSDKKLFISHVEVTGTFTQGCFVETTLNNGEVVTRWVERGG